MTRIDFYILPEQSRDNRYSLACRLAEKAWGQGHRVLIYTQNEELDRHMDRLLWTFREQSFIPHGIMNKVDKQRNPVLISSVDSPEDEHDVLINLSEHIPEFFSRFERVAECIDNEEHTKTAGRTHFRYYKDHGYQVESHKL